jgi:hypothetical protein
MPWIRKGDGYFLEGEPNYDEKWIRCALEKVKQEARGELGEVWTEIERFLCTRLATKHLIRELSGLWDVNEEVRWAVNARTIARSLFNNQIPCAETHNAKAYEIWWEKVLRRQPAKVIRQYNKPVQFSKEDEELRRKNRLAVRLGESRKR